MQRWNTLYMKKIRLCHNLSSSEIFQFVTLIRLRKLDCVVLLTSSPAVIFFRKSQSLVFSVQWTEFGPLAHYLCVCVCVCLCLCTPFYCFQLISLSPITYKTQVYRCARVHWADKYSRIDFELVLRSLGPKCVH